MRGRKRKDDWISMKRIQFIHLLSINCAFRATCHALPPDEKLAHAQVDRGGSTTRARKANLSVSQLCSLSPDPSRKVACPHRNWNDSQHGIWTILVVGAFQGRRKPRQARLSVNASGHPLTIGHPNVFTRLSGEDLQVAPSAWTLFLRRHLAGSSASHSGTVARSTHF
jgi:hypothetical protein